MLDETVVLRQLCSIDLKSLTEAQGKELGLAMGEVGDLNEQRTIYNARVLDRLGTLLETLLVVSVACLVGWCPIGLAVGLMLIQAARLLILVAAQRFGPSRARWERAAERWHDCIESLRTTDPGPRPVDA